MIESIPSILMFTVGYGLSFITWVGGFIFLKGANAGAAWLMVIFGHILMFIAGLGFMLYMMSLLGV